MSDAFLNLNMQKPSYEKEQQNLQDGDKKVEAEEESKKSRGRMTITPTMTLRETKRIQMVSKLKISPMA